MRDIPERIDTTFRFVLLVAHRAEQLMKGALPKLEPQGRATRQALAEIDQGAITWDYGPAPVVEQPVPDEEEAAEQAEAQ